MIKARSKRTLRQQMFNPASGVPLVNNAANLSHFFSARGYTSDGWADERGDVVLAQWPNNALNGLVGNQVWFGGSGIMTATGSWSAISETADVLFVVSGHRTDASGWDGENPSLTFRIGINESGYGTIRLRAPTVVQNFGDQIQDDAGNAADGNTTPALPARDAPEDGSHYILIGALQRGGTDYWHTVTWMESGYHQNDSTDISSLSIGAITPRTQDQGLSSSTSSSTIVGKFYGAGVWVFDDGLPDDFRQAGLMMGMAWASSKYTFWPSWGII